MRELTPGVDCLLCGEPVDGHDETRCLAAVAGWQSADVTTAPSREIDPPAKITGRVEGRLGEGPIPFDVMPRAFREATAQRAAAEAGREAAELESLATRMLAELGTETPQGCGLRLRAAGLRLVEAGWRRLTGEPDGATGGSGDAPETPSPIRP